jgi:2-polyprenyl-6-methoxyphenol hydroxylase-like FAD-dependent oxidoreductase
MSKRHQVVIVGGGPVGVALAVELGQRGIDCALVERRREPQRIPKGQNLTQRSVEHFYFWGVAEELRAARMLPPEYPMSGIVAYRDLNNEYWYAPPLREIVNSYYFQNNERLPQYQSEYVLRARMAQLAGVEARFGWVAETIEQDASGVRVTIAKDGGAEREVLEAEYVVGCDGGHSMVRQQIGIERGGADFNELMVLALFRSRELHEKLKRFPPRSTYRVIHPDLGGYWQFFGRVDVGESWFFHSPVPANTTRDNYDFRGLLQKVAGFSFACDFDYVGFWDLRIAVAEKYQVGRVFIASTTWSISAGRSRQSSKAGAATRCWRPTPRNGVPYSRKRPKTSSRRASKETRNFSTIIAPTMIARSSSAPGRTTPTPRRRGC